MSLPDLQLDALIAAFPGEVGLVVRDLTDGRTYAHEADRRFLTASVFKLPVMVELFRQAEAGLHGFDDQHLIHEGLCRHGTHAEESAVGTAWSLLDLCRRMIADSDDIATDLILEVIGVDAVNPTMEALGFVNTRVCMPIGRWHYRAVGLGEAPINPENDAIGMGRVRAGQIDFAGPAYTDLQDNNVTSARDMADMLERIRAGTLLSPDASKRMLEMLHGCEHRGMIPRHLDPAIPVAHKIGQSERIRADVGIVEVPRRPLIISALTLAEEVGDARPGRELVAEVARLGVEAVTE